MPSWTKTEPPQDFVFLLLFFIFLEFSRHCGGEVREKKEKKTMQLLNTARGQEWVYILHKNFLKAMLGENRMKGRELNVTVRTYVLCTTRGILRR